MSKIKWPNSWQKIRYISSRFWGKEIFLKKKALVIKGRLINVTLSKLRTFVYQKTSESEKTS